MVFEFCVLVEGIKLCFKIIIKKKIEKYDIKKIFHPGKN